MMIEYRKPRPHICTYGVFCVKHVHVLIIRIVLIVVGFVKMLPAELFVSDQCSTDRVHLTHIKGHRMDIWTDTHKQAVTSSLHGNETHTDQY